MDWKESKNIKDNTYEFPGHWLNLEYYEALNILFRVENTLRVFVYIILKNQFKNKWKDLSITSDDQENSTINGIAKKRLSADRNYAYLGYTITSPLLHLTSGELIKLIISDSYWKYFKTYFLGSREIIKNKLDEIGNIRNSLAHFRPLKKGDIQVVKQNSNHTLSLIEKAVSGFINCNDIVPTNTEDDWYLNMKKIESPVLKLNFNQSIDEQWIKLNLSFELPKLFESLTDYGSYNLKTINIKSDNILIKHPKLTELLICCTEKSEYIYTSEPDKSEYRKYIYFTFSREKLSENHEKIVNEISKIINIIESELALIQDDHLARGKFTEVKKLYSHKDERGFYTLNFEDFITQISEKTPVEYWGKLNYCSNDFISDTDIYPWMPVEISEDRDLPF